MGKSSAFRNGNFTDSACEIPNAVPISDVCCKMSAQNWCENSMKSSPDPRRSRRARRSFDIERLIGEYPRRAAALRELFGYFQAGSFLPNLHAANLFVSRWSHDEARRLRARAAAPPIVFGILASVSDEEFQGILEGARLRAAGMSDLAIISQAILGSRTPAD